VKKNIFVLVLILSTISYSQIYDPHRFEMAFSRIEQAFETASPENIWPLICSRTTIRIEDSLYLDISSIQSESVLKDFFQNKDSVEFMFAGKFGHYRTAEGNGVMTYVSKKIKESINVDVYLNEFGSISAINISNYPSSTAFYNFSR
jgi:hypothetical protein